MNRKSIIDLFISLRVILKLKKDFVLERFFERNDLERNLLINYKT